MNECPDGWVLRNYRCEICFQNCLKCEVNSENKVICNECDESSLFNGDKTSCYIGNCPDATYRDKGACLPCK